MLAYVLVALLESDEKGILDKFTAHPEVKEGHILFGEWDLILKVDLPSSEALGTFVLDKIRSSKDVKMSSTLIVAA